MFDIITNVTNEESNRLRVQGNHVREIAYSTECVKNSLESLSGMDEIISNLRGVISNIHNEADLVQLMGQSLEKIGYLYSSSENMICDNAEVNVVRYNRWKIDAIDISAISRMLDSQ